jgi:hypothetical protein
MRRLVGSTEYTKNLCEVLDPDGNGNARKYEVAASGVCDQRRLFLTKTGHIGIGPAAMKSTDRICILFGTRQPVILRRNGANHQFIGEGFEDYKIGKQTAELFKLC